MKHSILPAYIQTKRAIHHHNKTTWHKTVGPLVCPGIFAVKANQHWGTSRAGIEICLWVFGKWSNHNKLGHL